MIASPPPVPSKAKTTLLNSAKSDVQPTGLQRVYVDGRHHLSSHLALTLCGLPTSKADVVKRGDVECSTCRDVAEVQP